MSENSDQSLKPTVTYSGENTLLIPCEPKDFGRFVSGLLGETQSIHRRVRGPYEVTKPDIVNIFALVDQRLKRQNDSSLIEFSATTSYSDGSSVRVGSLDEFNRYGEVKPLISTDITIQWKILIKFPHSNIPEKQEITVSFITWREEDDEDSPSFSAKWSEQYVDVIIVRVEHTDRTWGADIENMLVAHMGLLIKPDQKWRLFARQHASTISTVTASSVIIAGVWAIGQAASIVQEKSTALLQRAEGPQMADLPALVAQTEAISNLMSLGMWEKFSLYSSGFLIAIVSCSILIGTAMNLFLRKRKRSYVLLTARTILQRDKEQTERKNNGYTLTAYIIGSILLAVAGNYAFAFAIKVWQP